MREAVRAEDDATARAILQWRVSDGIPARDALGMAVPGLARHVPEFACDAKVGRESLLRWSFPSETVVPRALASMSETQPALLEDCVDHWTSVLHTIIKHDDQPPIPDEPKRPRNAKLPCSQCRVCMCGEHGDALWNFKVWFIREVFHSFAAQEPKHLLDDAGVFFSDRIRTH